MLIEDCRDFALTVQLASLVEGETFLLDECLYLRTQSRISNEGKVLNCVNLTMNKIASIDHIQPVIRVDHKVQMLPYKKAVK
jgi:hypothetical protein